jgi:hypothetical protein
VFLDSDRLIALDNADRTDVRARVHDTWLLWDDGFTPAMQSLLVWLGQALRTRGLHPRIVCVTPPPASLRRMAADCNVPIVDGCSSLKSLRKLAANARPGLIHTFGRRAALLGRLTGLALDIPVVSTLQQSASGRDCSALALVADRITLGLSRGLIALRGAAERQWPERARVIDRFAPLAPRPTALPKTIVFMSQTGQAEQAKLLYRLANMLPPMQFAIQYDADPKDPRLLEDGVPNCRILSNEPVPWTELGLLVVTGHDDWDLQRALEAMAHGLPVIALSGGCWLDMIESGVNGWLIPRGNLASLARQLDKWDTMADADRRCLSDGARQTVAARFSPDTAVTDVLEVYAQALRHRPPR